MIYGSEPNETDLANHDDDWYDHSDSPNGRGQSGGVGTCHTCVHSGCCEHSCGGLSYSPQYVECYECGRTVDVTDEAFDPSEVDPDYDRGKFNGNEIFCRECADKLDGKLHLIEAKEGDDE